MSGQIASVENEYAKDKKLRADDVQALREWMQKQPHLPEISELQLVQFLQSCYFSVEMTKATIDNFFTVRTHFEDTFANRTPNWAPLVESMNINLYTFLSKRTGEDHVVLYGKLMSSDSSRYTFAEQLKCFDMVIMLWLRQNGTAEGLRIVTDMKEVALGHVAKLNLTVMKKFMFYLQEALPVRLKGLHFINVVPFMDKIMALVRPFMKKELLSMLFIHTESNEALYRYVPKECLPSDLGGTDDTIANLHAKMIKQFTENSNYFQEDERQVVDESKRPGKPKNVSDVFGVEGSFKKLEMD